MLKFLNFFNFSSIFFLKNCIYFFFCDLFYLYIYNFYYFKFILFKNINLYYKNNFLLFFKQDILFIYNFFKLLFKNFFNIYFIEMLLDGLYYRIKYYKKLNYIGFILGYNHYILYKLPLNIYLKLHMKKRRFFIYSINKNLLSQVSMNLVFLKYPNLFKGKGVKIINYNYRLKILKKKK